MRSRPLARLGFSWSLVAGAWALAGLLAMASPASAATTTLTVHNVSAKVSQAEIVRVERAMIEQVTQFRRFWHVSSIAFAASGGLPILLFGGAVASYHQPDRIIVATGSASNNFTLLGHGGRRASWTVVFSHEVLEMLADPTGQRSAHGRPLEVCDAVEADTYRLDGVLVSDFVTPRWFGLRGHGPYDYERRTHARFQVARGGYSAR